jgi:beta-barrel assembly-enhancing protease
MLPSVAQRCLPAIALAVATACGRGESVSESDERDWGAYQAGYIDSSVALISDSAITGFIDSLARSMTSRTSRADLDWQFRVANVSLVNAMALPGGFVYVSRGLMEQSGHAHELAGVMAHEIGHVVRRHSVEQLQRSAKERVALLMLCTLTNACSSVGGAIAVRVGTDAATAQYSQDDEREADSMAVVITAAAGIDPEGLPAFLQWMLDHRAEQPTPLEAFFASHPTDEARIAALRRQIRALGHSAQRKLIRDIPEFHTAQDRLQAMPPAPPLPEEYSAAESGSRRARTITAARRDARLSQRRGVP